MNAPLPADRLSMRLEDRYTIEEGWVYLTGMQALVRLPIQQRMRDAAAGLSTGGYVSGYRGSPLGRYDMEMWQAQPLLEKYRIVFRAGVNEDLAATAIWGAQYVGVFPGAQVDGVFGIWYGKGPGVDRSGDVLRHANLAGTSPAGGVLALAGDDHGAKSSTVANYSDLNFVAAGIPLFAPSNAQEVLDYGLHGIALSRFAGCWSAMKLVTDVVEGGGSVRVAPDWPPVVRPEGLTMPEGGVHTRPFDMALPQEDRLYHHKLYLALGYIRANDLNRVVFGGHPARIGVVAAGKAWQDVRQALASLGIDEARAAALGVRLLKVGVVWPLDPEIVRRFADGLETLVVVEEKRPLLEDQIRAVLYGSERPPRIVGKFADGVVFDPVRGDAVFPNAGEISPALVARVIARVLIQADPGVALATPAIGAHAEGPPAPPRLPNFCSGCPHSRSTKVPDGSRALAGIGCHTIAMLNDPTKTTTVSHMGGEGAMWLGQQPFTDERHVFANMGDGTYFHSGFLAIRAAVAAGVPMTYKLLYNGFVSMTGGQPVDGDLGVERVLGELKAEGVGKLALVTDDPDKYKDIRLPEGVPVHHRDELDAVQREFREYPGVSVIVFEQPCATERRRLRKRGRMPDPPRRTYINSAVCEGCGDCGTVSNCLSVEPLETPLGRKRRINQSSCNKDFSCTEGFCPSFVTIHGGELRRRRDEDAATGTAPIDESVFDGLPDPAPERLDRSWSILVTGIGGTGVVTIGQTVAVAAHLDGLYSSNLDVTGLAQKYGAVHSHVKIAPDAAMLHATRIADGEADTLIGCDLIVSAGAETLGRLRPGRSGGVLCTDMVPTAEFARNPDWNADASALAGRVAAALGERQRLFDAQAMARILMGDAIAANMILLGAAWQLGLVPVSAVALDRAIELNGVAVDFNRHAFLWGRRAAHDPQRVRALVDAHTPAQVIRFDPQRVERLDELLADREQRLRDYGGRALAKRYRRRVEAVRDAEAAAGLGEKLACTVARYLYKLMAAKDEWEVMRLFASPAFREELEATFEGEWKPHFHLAGGPFGKRDDSGKLAKREVGPWVWPLMRLGAKLRFLRGSFLDPFRNSAERALHQRLLVEYEADLDLILAKLDAATHADALALAALPERIRGYGHVREAHVERVAPRRAELIGAIGAGGEVRAREAA
jgi:indolepyruvate ferredoxin oxidoreductase